MSRYNILLKKPPQKKEEEKSEPLIKFKKILVGNRGSGKTPALIKEILFAFKNSMHPIAVYLPHFNNRDRFKRDLRELFKHCHFKPIDRQTLHEMFSYKVVFIDDLPLNSEFFNFVMTHVHYSGIEGAIITCDLIDFIGFMGQRDAIWKRIRSSWIVRQLDG